jgi:hypothetical protein
MAVAALAVPALAAGQGGHVHDPETATHAAMSGPMDTRSAHLTMSPARPATAADSARAMATVAELRRAVEKYKDVRVAEADGYRQFAPNVPQEIYHFTSTWRSIKESFRWDPTQPSSLLYRKTPDGKIQLVGAMYHAPKRLAADKLDQRVPLSVARWHKHTNLCVPKLKDRDRWLETKDGKPLFGPKGTITTREQCSAEGGKFHDQVFGWMVHAMLYEGDDPAKIWGSHESHDDHGGGHHHPPPR